VESGPARGAARRVAANTSWLVGADAVSKVTLLVLYAVMARELGKDGFGVFTLAVSVSLFVEFAGLGTDLILAREVARDADHVHGLFWNSIAIKVVIGIPALAGVMGFSVAAGYTGDALLTIALISVAKLLDVVSQTFAATFRGREEMRPPATALTVQRLGIAFIGSFALISLNAGVVAIGIVYVGSSVAALAVLWWLLHRREMRPRVEVSRERGWWLAIVALPAGIATFFGAALARVDALILSLLTDHATVGLYGAAYRLFDGTLFLTWGFGLAIFPVLSRLNADSSPSLRTVFELASKLITAMLLPFGMVMALFGPVIVSTLYGHTFDGAAAATQLLGGATFLYGPFAIAALAAAARDRQKWVLWVTGPGLALNVALNFALIPSMSLNGAALAMTITQGLMAVAMIGLVTRLTGALSIARMFVGPAVAALGMCAAALILGTGGLGFAVACLVYAPLLLLTERALHPDDFGLLRSIAGSARSAEVEVAASGV
jgi:O-antigen/teichoic acid export membrane protein